MKKILKTIYYVVIGVVVFIALLIIVSAFPVAGNIKMFTVLSGSMEPKIHTGSAVIVKPVSDYKVGDVITFGKIAKGSVPTTHRIVDQKVQDGNVVYMTKGDANDVSDDNEIPKEEIVGRELFSIPWLGYIINFVQKPFGLMLVIIIPSIIIIYNQIQNIGKEIKKMGFKMTKVEKEVEEIVEEEKQYEKNKEQK